MLEMDVRDLRHGGPSGIGDDNLRAVVLRRAYAPPDYGMGFRRVRAYCEYALCIGNLVVGIGHRAAAERPHEPRNGRGVTRPRAVVHVVGAEDGPGEFLGQVVHLVSAPCRAPDAQAVASVLLADFFQVDRDRFEGLLPCRFLEFPIDLNQWPFQPLGMVYEFPRVPSLHAEMSPVGNPVDAGRNPNGPAVLNLEIQVAAGPAIWTDGQDVLHLFGTLLPGWPAIVYARNSVTLETHEGLPEC